MATKTPTASYGSFSLYNIALAGMLSIVRLRDYALTLGILVIRFLTDLEFEPLNSPRCLQFGIGKKLPINPLLFRFLDSMKLQYLS